MSSCFAFFYDRFMRASEEACLAQWRKELLSPIMGQTLEIGAGTGVNLDYYSPEIKELTLSEPDKAMRKILTSRLEKSPFKDRWKICDQPVEALPFEKERFDTIVSTLVLCSVTDTKQALSELHRVLKKGGDLIFIEHVAAPANSKRHRWQQRLEPIWKIFAAGCHVTRDTEASLVQSGFDVTEIKRASMRKALPIIRPTIRGRAVKL
jgi:ubiquinone/menaquinone biosynthesis C-methylase UbiE